MTGIEIVLFDDTTQTVESAIAAGLHALQLIGSEALEDAFH